MVLEEGYDLERLAAAIEVAFADLLPVRPVARLGAGFRSLVVETASGFAIKVGTQPEAAADYVREWRLRHLVRGYLPSLVPVALAYAEPGDIFKYGALGYRKLPGATPRWGSDPGPRFARDLGAFMARLHNLPVDEALAASLPVVDSYERLLGARDVVLPVLRRTLPSDELGKVENWWASISADTSMSTIRRAVCHQDLWHDNLLLGGEGELSGVLDLAHMEIGDPAHDFSAPQYFGEVFMGELVSAYRAAGGVLEPADAYRARRFSEGREFGGLAWAIEHDDQAEIEESIAKVLRSPAIVS